MGGFSAPSWAVHPKYNAYCEVQINGEPEESVNIGAKSFYLFGRDASTCDFAFDDKTVSRIHAAMVHSKDGSLYVIDLNSTHGTTVGNTKIASHKPTALRNGVIVKFGSAAKSYKLELEGTAADGTGGGAQGDAGGKRKAEAGGGGDAAKKGKGETVWVRHLLVKHKDSRKPKSWKEPDGITRTKEEAETLVMAFRKEIEEGGAAETFEELATEESHCSSHRRGGDLGEVLRGKMQPPFEKAAFALTVGELSGPVFSDSGVHIVYRYK